MLVHLTRHNKFNCISHISNLVVYLSTERIGSRYPSLDISKLLELIRRELALFQCTSKSVKYAHTRTIKLRYHREIQIIFGFTFSIHVTLLLLLLLSLSLLLLLLLLRLLVPLLLDNTINIRLLSSFFYGIFSFSLCVWVCFRAVVCVYVYIINSYFCCFPVKFRNIRAYNRKYEYFYTPHTSKYILARLNTYSLACSARFNFLSIHIKGWNKSADWASDTGLMDFQLNLILDYINGSQSSIKPQKLLALNQRQMICTAFVLTFPWISIAICFSWTYSTKQTWEYRPNISGAHHSTHAAIPQLRQLPIAVSIAVQYNCQRK